MLLYLLLTLNRDAPAFLHDITFFRVAAFFSDIAFFNAVAVFHTTLFRSDRFLPRRLKRPKKRPKKPLDTRPRVLCAVNRVGTLAKGLLIHSDPNVDLVLLCGPVPTEQLLDRVLEHLPGACCVSCLATVESARVWVVASLSVMLSFLSPLLPDLGPELSLCRKRT